MISIDVDEEAAGEGQLLRACLRRSSWFREDASLLAGGGAAAGESSGRGVDRGPADHGLGHGGVAFVVAGKTAVRGEPGEGPPVGVG
jgi:hypothetical protein